MLFVNILYLMCLFSTVRSVCKNVKDGDSVHTIANNMRFLIHSRTKNDSFTIDNIEKLKSNFNFLKPTKILIHGWKNSFNSSFNRILLKAYLNRYDTNVLIVEWANYSGCNLYWQSKNNVPYIGRTVAFIVDKMNKILTMRPSDIHVIGFSLGAHVAGVAGSELTTGKFSRITGLDPAGPFFSMSDKYRLRNVSALFVDVIHTGMKVAGTRHRIGHADFYPNGGISGLNVVKSHRNAYYLFNESIGTPGGFIAAECFSWIWFKEHKCDQSGTVEMGEYVNPRNFLMRAEHSIETSKTLEIYK